MIFYLEQRRFDGGWAPVLIHGDAPVTKTVNGRMRLQTANGQGQEVRAVQPVPHTKLDASLKHLQAVLSPDGHLQATQRAQGCFA